MEKTVERPLDSPLIPPSYADAPPHPAKRSAAANLGLLALAFKLGPKLFALLAKFFKGGVAVKGGLFAGSFGAYALLWNWYTAVALLFMLFVHEYGHVHAMKKSGMKVKGMYFIPLLGAAAVSEEAFRSRKQQVYVALNGPLWGFWLTLAAVGVLLWLTYSGSALGQATFLDTNYPVTDFIGAVAILWATINLFNMLPVSPLDGGRVLSGIAFSLNSSIGIAVSLISFVLLFALVLFLQLWLLIILLPIGLIEFMAEWRSHRARRKAAAAQHGDLSQSPVSHEAPEYAYRAQESAFEPRGQQVAQSPEMTASTQELSGANEAFSTEVPPMSTRQVIAYSFAYAGLAIAYIAVIYLQPENAASLFARNLFG